MSHMKPWYKLLEAPVGVPTNGGKKELLDPSYELLDPTCGKKKNTSSGLSNHHPHTLWLLHCCFDLEDRLHSAMLLV